MQQAPTALEWPWNSTAPTPYGSSLDDTHTWSLRSCACPPAALHRLVGDWRLFFDTGAVRQLSIAREDAFVERDVIDALGQRRIHGGGRRGPVKYVASVASVGATDSAPPPAALVEERTIDGFTHLVTALRVPAILGAESSDDVPVQRTYRIRARFCIETAILEAFDLTDGALEDGLQWALRRAIGIRGALPVHVPLVTPGYLLPRAFELISQVKVWNAIEFASSLQGREENLGVVAVNKNGEISTHAIVTDRSSWRQRLMLDTPQRTQFGTLLAGGQQPERIWHVLLARGFLVMPCGVCEGEAFKAAVGCRQSRGHARFGQMSYCFYHKQGKPGPVPSLRSSMERVVLPVFKHRGPAGRDVRTAGVRLGNVLFLVAASIALALDHDMALCLTVSAAWRDYFLEPDAILSELPSSLWYHRDTDADIMLGSPAGMGFEELHVPQSARSVMMHGYFQNPQYFLHRLEDVRGLLSPPGLARSAEAIWLQTATHAGLIMSRPSARIAVHVRKGDVRLWLGIPFYRDAVAYASRSLNQPITCVLFSDMSSDSLKQLPQQIGCNRHLVFTADVRDDIVLMVMAICCNAIVISASTFSWWAAILGNYATVIAPQTTLPLCSNKTLPFKLGYMQGWSRLPVPCT